MAVFAEARLHGYTAQTPITWGPASAGLMNLCFTTMLWILQRGDKLYNDDTSHTCVEPSNTKQLSAVPRQALEMHVSVSASDQTRNTHDSLFDPIWSFVWHFSPDFLNTNFAQRDKHNSKLRKHPIWSRVWRFGTEQSHSGHIVYFYYQHLSCTSQAQIHLLWNSYF